MKEFIERDCVFEVDGKKFESRGAYFITGKNGKSLALLFGDWNAPDYCHNGFAGNWHSDIRFPVRYGKVFIGNMGDKRRWVSLTIDGKNFRGLWAGIGYNQTINFKQTK